MNEVIAALAQAYLTAPSAWIASYGRVSNRLRNTLYDGAKQALTRLEAIPEAERPVTYWGAQQALLGMQRAGSGTDPRGGPERDQMCRAMDQVAREMARAAVTAAEVTS